MNVDEMIYKIQLITDTCDWDDLDELPNEMLTIDNLLELVRHYKDKCNDAFCEIDNIIGYYEARRDLGLD